MESIAVTSGGGKVSMHHIMDKITHTIMDCKKILFTLDI